MKYMLMDYVGEAGWPRLPRAEQERWLGAYNAYMEAMAKAGDRKSTRLNSSHLVISYAVFCFRKKPTAPQRVLFFFNDTATTEIYTLSLHDALPISNRDSPGVIRQEGDPNEIHADGLRGRGRLAPAATSRARTLAGSL